MLVGVLVACAVALAACETQSARHATRSTSSTTVSSSTTTTGPPITYQVKSGDTLTAIAGFFGVPTAVLAATNHLANGDQLTVGQVLQIPRRPPIQLNVAPPAGPAGEAFKLELIGAQAGEAIRFEIDVPDGDKFTGPPHTASPAGSVTASYQTGLGDTPGMYKVVATGDHGSSVSASFRVEPSSPNA